MSTLTKWKFLFLPATSLRTGESSLQGPHQLINQSISQIGWFSYTAEKSTRTGSVDLRTVVNSLRLFNSDRHPLPIVDISPAYN
jgi:hypothetical protein